jgi:hypothetical protein
MIEKNSSTNDSEVFRSYLCPNISSAFYELLELIHATPKTIIHALEALKKVKDNKNVTK